MTTDRLTPEFLERNGFKKPGQTAGWTHWYYTTDNYEIVVSPGDSVVSVVNYVTGEQISFGNRRNRALTCTLDNLVRCLEFLHIDNPFGNEENK